MKLGSIQHGPKNRDLPQNGTISEMCLLTSRSAGDVKPTSRLELIRFCSKSSGSHFVFSYFHEVGAVKNWMRKLFTSGTSRYSTAQVGRLSIIIIISTYLGTLQS